MMNFGKYQVEFLKLVFERKRKFFNSVVNLNKYFLESQEVPAEVEGMKNLFFLLVVSHGSLF